MDPVTQGLFGAVAGAMVAPKRHVKYAAVAGAFAALTPDLDVLIRSGTDPLLSIQFHRHFTHALAFIPIGGLLCALLLRRFMRARVSSFALLVLYTTVGYATHGLVDAMTNYGTHLLWPLSDHRTSWNIVSIIDPLVTLPLLAGFLITLRNGQREALLGAFAAVAVYLGFGALQHHRADQALHALAQARGHVPQRPVTKPSFANMLVWRSTYLHAGNYYIDALRISTGGEVTVYPGGALSAVDAQSVFPALPEGSVQRRDIERFAFFSDGYLALKPDDPNVIADIRFAMLPDQLAPLWGIRINPAAPQTHVTFEQFRTREQRDYRRFWGMITGTLPGRGARILISIIVALRLDPRAYPYNDGSSAQGRG